MAISVGDMLSGLGAAIGGRGQEFVQGLQTREAEAQKQKQEEMAFRQQAMYQDAYAGLQLLEQGDLTGIIELGKDRMDMLRQFPDADPSDTARIIQLAMYAQRGDRNALAQLHAELMSATRQGMARGILKAPEQTKGVVVGENLVDPITGRLIYQGQQKITPYTDIGKLQQDFSSGLITRQQYDSEVKRLSAAAADNTEWEAARTQINQGVSRTKTLASDAIEGFGRLDTLADQIRAAQVPGAGELTVRAGRQAAATMLTIMARLASPGIVTEQDFRNQTGAQSTVGGILNYLASAGQQDPNIASMLAAYDPTNPQSLDVDAMLNQARGLTQGTASAVLNNFAGYYEQASAFGAPERYMTGTFGERPSASISKLAEIAYPNMFNRSEFYASPYNYMESFGATVQPETQKPDITMNSQAELDAMLSANWSPAPGQNVFIVDPATGQKYKVNFNPAGQ